MLEENVAEVAGTTSSEVSWTFAAVGKH